MSVPDLCSPATARAVARRFGISPRRELGQNFLIDRRVRDAIVASAGSADRVLEIGPGLGALTQGLLERGVQVVGVELDPRCVAALGLLGSHYPGLTVVEADILRVSPAQLGLPGPTVLGNLPYQITGALLPHLMRWDPPAQACHLLVQREVGRRLAASHGDWSLATLVLRAVAEVEVEFDVAPDCFWPSPQVYSSLISVRPRPGVDPELATALADLARPMFQARRKQLHHGLARSLGITPGEALVFLQSIAIDPVRRPGSLELEEWRVLISAVRDRGTPIR
ncbi:MAG TPA: 16S rRNA (adenine(1518)-N(6)/adenine(1519)-N(6))-dimethyltransferase RsmA [Candidatus Dormibacteraeota bacterium]|nr:16S rRNA (adenine(1518)-N(6)/adenine(1519)-N(6))-dimethyltransferase RsmA [Candidatus Dormibacteraeota bacterium]